MQRLGFFFLGRLGSTTRLLSSSKITHSRPPTPRIDLHQYQTPPTPLRSPPISPTLHPQPSILPLSILPSPYSPSHLPTSASPPPSHLHLYLLPSKPALNPPFFFLFFRCVGLGCFFPVYYFFFLLFFAFFFFCLLCFWAGLDIFCLGTSM